MLSILLFFGHVPISCAAQGVASPAAPKTVAPAELDRAIDQVIHQRKYIWRLPREAEAPAPVEEPGIIRRFFDQVGRMIRSALETIGEWLGRVFGWIGRMIGRLFGRWPSVNLGEPAGLNWYLLSRILLFVLIAVVVAAAVILLRRLWLNRRRPTPVLQTEAIQPVPDLMDESVGADQLPEDGWTKLARELLARGEFRLALRAFYLASLAHLAERNLLSLTRFKSNHEYELELRRRAHSFPNLLQVFVENVGAFDRVWYGTHEASSELVMQFAANVERIKSGG